MTIYRCDDGNCEIEIEAESSEEAAQQYVDGGDWGDDTSTIFVDVQVQEKGDDDYWQTIIVAVDPTEPECTTDEHDWQSPYDLLGGLEENPGVWGHGGGVIIKEVCVCCGCARTTDTWAQGPGGRQGLTSVKYEEEEHLRYLIGIAEKAGQECADSTWEAGLDKVLDSLDDAYDCEPAEGDCEYLLEALGHESSNAAVGDLHDDIARAFENAYQDHVRDLAEEAI